MNMQTQDVDRIIKASNELIKVLSTCRVEIRLQHINETSRESEWIAYLHSQSSHV